MNLLLALMTAAFLLTGYWLMKRLDFYLSNHVISNDNQELTVIDVALCAGKEQSGILGPILDEAGISFDLFEGDFDYSGREYRLVCALWEDDLRNLLICSLGRRFDKGCVVLAKCNNALYRNLYRDAGAHCLCESEVTFERISRELQNIRDDMREQGDSTC